MARRVKSFQTVPEFFNVIHCIAGQWISIHVKGSIFFFRHLLKRFHAMFGLTGGPGGVDDFLSSGKDRLFEPVSQGFE